MKSILILLSFVCWTFLSNPVTNLSNEPDTAFELQASTPGDSLIKTMLNIDQSFPVDFIRWHLLMQPESQTFDLSINYGINQPNTLGFTAAGQKQSIQGSYQVRSGPHGEVYQLKSETAKVAFSFLQLNEDLYHLLDADQQLMLGNGGWSYSLNRKTPSHQKSPLPALAAATLSKSTPYVAVFDGRTPCSELAAEYAIPVSTECIKLKWRLTLYRDSTSKQPTTYTLTRIFRRAQAITGKWSINQKGEATIYQLHPDEKRDEALQFLVGDENVLFFLDKKQQLLVGDENFSFALNKKLK
ncbi:copper resistance protein NlpE N-terminal domain-containing protein [Haliscomenobacter hydrossis]|uniref:Uncharacterized protein n=1 Tax=Haliscomenobacter hydrossis (strain ATCC 27775 / DSM 1100 / LMG 10767 / O) TaxID=760192 RepID=F4L606_HALH1|nr:copper resistance protein NlpE N-terminal domain-containing protein [Haliscomenobacter hydrossis]AEE53066.1 hypothetical protein Halhy_5240 [Haliscomenobacter hydrossis DSM 1100]